MANRSYEPASRERHVSFAVEGKVYMWGGNKKSSEDGEIVGSIEQFDPYLEVWSQLPTMRTPHPGLYGAACTSFGRRMYIYGGRIKEDMICAAGVLSCLDIQTFAWSMFYSTSGGPMGKTGCGMVHFHHDKLAVIGGHGILTGSTQPGSSFIRNTRYTDGRGWTNEIHVFNISRGIWFSPPVRGTRPPPCSGFTLTSIDKHQAVLFGGYQPGCGRVNDLYLIDFNTMEITKVEPCEGEPWPVGRGGHAACCLGDHVHLLVTGGMGGEGKTLKDIWLFNLSLRKWMEVFLPDGTVILPRVYHSAIAVTLCPGLVEVIKFGGKVEMEDLYSGAFETVAETNIITFSKVGSEWQLVGVTNNSQWGTNERIREKILKISEKARAAIDDGPVSSPQASERALQERVEGAVREERLRAQQVERRLQERAEAAEERSQDLETTLIEERQRIQALERMFQDMTERAEAAEERSQELEDTLREERQRNQIVERRHAEEIQTERHRANERVREIEQQLAASQERERAAEVRVQEVHQAEERAQAAERRSHELQQRAHNAEQRTIGTERRAHNAEQRVHEAEQRVHYLQQRVHIAEQHTAEVERRLHVAEQRMRESERRERQAGSVVQQSQQESHWLVQRTEIELTEEEKGRGGWAAVKVANFRGTRVAAKCFYQQILVSRYNCQLFIREMNMAARLRHPNLVQFIGASLEGEPIILTELMTTSLRAELEKGPIEHAHITSISLDVARAINYLHLMQPHPIIHRDISSANVLLDPLPNNGWKAKVSDYGSVNLLRELQTIGPGNPVYAAPEASVPAEQSPKMDIFSFGVLLIEMLTDEFPAEDARQRLLDSINHAGFKDLIRRCLREQKEERPSANEIIANIQDM